MAQIQRLYDFQPGTKALSQQVDEELNQLVNAHNTLDTDLTNHKSSGDHDGRYYTKTQLDNGQLDNRYYTETELNNGALDGRYYTESEVDTKTTNLQNQINTHKISADHDTRYYTKTQLDGGQLDNRYYTKVELSGSGGASKIGITPINGLTASNAQQALEEINSRVNQYTLGQIPDGSITLQKLAFDPATQAELDTVINNLNTHSAETASKFTNINLNIIDMAVELETLKGATLNGVTANIFIETFTNLNDINLMNGGYDSVNKRLVL
ncbi:hypothetical protein P9726_13625 [Geobacillus stearothermophilus]|uniref:hypothetical protein n=1 Tax=Geobacillus stearothermophilus TaxID=1422 RepID=UPI002E22E6F3|nr:hypothetical protein [Geobacillus stearothermophilus]